MTERLSNNTSRFVTSSAELYEQGEESWEVNLMECYSPRGAHGLFSSCGAGKGLILIGLQQLLQICGFFNLTVFPHWLRKELKCNIYRRKFKYCS